jgi:hypothetical protein
LLLSKPNKKIETIFNNHMLYYEKYNLLVY